MKDFYQLLGVQRNATAREIETAYLQAMQRLENEGDDSLLRESEDNLIDAYATLSDETLRNQYDEECWNELKKWEKMSIPTEQKRRRARRLPLFVTAIAVVGALFFHFSSGGWQNWKFLLGGNTVQLQQTTDSLVSFSDILQAERIMLVTDGSNRISLSDFPNKEFARDHPAWRKAQFQDLDGDGVPELLVEYFSGGAHCCYHYELFVPIADKTYRSIYSFEGGEDGARINEGKLHIHFYEQAGYFFTCYACDIEDQIPGDFIPSFTLSYKNQQLHHEKASQATIDQIVADLRYLKQRDLPKPDDLQQDDGTRKAYALRLIAYYFNNGLDIVETKSLFSRTYSGSDSLLVWRGILQQINGIHDMRTSSEEYQRSVERMTKELKDFSRSN